jgi:uncharacterized membrane protein YccC
MTKSETKHLQWGRVIANQAVLAITCALVYVLMTSPVLPWPPETDQARAVGAIWAVVATIFVFRDTREDTLHLSMSRLVGTSLSFVLCEIYLLAFTFTPWGMALVIAVGGIIAAGIGRSGDAGIVAITTTVILVVASIGPANQAWQQPLLRLVDTLVGVIFGFGAATILSLVWTPRGKNIAGSN